jgi:tRNA 5-methylaminomethyl-2-thiouridine biosynthesis bifunctional protein
VSFGPLRPARIDFSDPDAPSAPDFGDVYHSRAGALAQARHVFLAGNRLPAGWAGRERYVVLETGFGLGNNFLATWQAWREDPARCERLVFVSIEKHPPRAEDLARALAGSALPNLATALLRAWPPLTPDIHTLDFEDGRVRLLLVLADLQAALPQLQLLADAVYLDGFAPARNPAMWEADALQRLARLCAPGATVATWSVARPLRDGLAAAGFVVERAPGFDGKREMSVGRHAPRFVAPLPPGRTASAARRAIVLGAGLAGAATARALARQGLAVDVIEQAAAPAAGASGNPGGLFHGIVHRQDGPHARWLRAAALRAQAVLKPLFETGQVPGAWGLLRGERQAPLEAMAALLAEQALPSDWVQAWTAAEVQAATGLATAQRAWFYPGGGWLAPGALVQHWLQQPGISLRCGSRVAAIETRANGWRLKDAAGVVLDEAELLVLANAGDAMRLLDHPGWPWQSVRGQVSRVPAGGLDLPLPLADGGYVLPLGTGEVLCGATADPDDEDPRLRAADHAANLATLRRLTGWRGQPEVPDPAGRVAWRMQVADRMPLLGPVPDATAPLPHRPAQPRQHARQPGLYIAAGLGSRGITHAALAGEVVAALITGAPLPLPSGLLDALDPARFAAREAARGRPRLNRSPAS